MANGKITYPSGAISQVTYNFVKNYDYGHEVGYIEVDDFQRAFDGTLNSYIGPRKKSFSLTFTRVLKSQLDAFMLAWMAGRPIDLYLDGTNLDATVLIVKPPIGKSEPAFVDSAFTYSFIVVFEEV